LQALKETDHNYEESFVLSIVSQNLDGAGNNLNEKGENFHASVCVDFFQMKPAR
jgi:hypothetical protein